MKITLLDGGIGQELVARAGDRPTPLWSTRAMMDHPGLLQGGPCRLLRRGRRYRHDEHLRDPPRPAGARRAGASVRAVARRGHGRGAGPPAPPMAVGASRAVSDRWPRPTGPNCTPTPRPPCRFTPRWCAWSRPAPTSSCSKVSRRWPMPRPRCRGPSWPIAACRSGWSVTLG